MKIQKRHWFVIFSFFLLILGIEIYQYTKTVKEEIVSAVTVGIPNPGHSLAQLECSADSLCVDTTNNRVGIGTTVPGAKEEISAGQTANNTGIPPASGSVSTAILRLASNNGNGEVLDSGMNIGPSYGWLQATNRGNLAVNYNLALEPNGGNVGIGTATPKQKLDINGNHVFGSKYVNLSTASTPILSVTFPSCHSGAYIKVYIGGVDWADHSGGGHYTEAFLIDGCGSYGEPGTIVVDRNSQIGSIATSLSISNHVITLSAALNSYSVNQLITYEVQGVFAAVN